VLLACREELADLAVGKKSSTGFCAWLGEVMRNFQKVVVRLLRVDPDFAHLIEPVHYGDQMSSNCLARSVVARGKPAGKPVLWGKVGFRVMKGSLGQYAVRGASDEEIRKLEVVCQRVMPKKQKRPKGIAIIKGLAIENLEYHPYHLSAFPFANAINSEAPQIDEWLEQIKRLVVL
jgi:hypothetical protein